MPPPTNKLTIYLIKGTYTNFDSIVKPLPHPPVVLNPEAYLYYTTSVPTPPDWLQDFFGNDQNIPQDQFVVSGTSAVLIYRVQIGATQRFFAIPFGSGRHLLNDHATEESFGLITTLNMVPADQLRSIDKRVVASNPKLSREQLAKVGSATDFGIDIERDLLHGVTGKPTITTFGKTVSGKDGFLVSARVDMTNIVPLLRECYRYFKKRSYKMTFPWVDQLKEIKDPSLLQDLNDKLVDLINTSPDEVTMAVPEIIEWNALAGFKYNSRKRDEPKGDLDINEFLIDTGLTGAATLDDLYNTPVTSWETDAEHYKMKWDAYRCLNAEVTISQKLYILSNGKWYYIDRDFVNSVRSVVDSIPLWSQALPIYNHADEAEYNIDLAAQLSGHCMDADNIMYGGARSKIEFCDVLAPGKKVIHVKRYGGSSVLSHLFSQGNVSAELLAIDQNFRIALRTKLPHGFKSIVPTTTPLKTSDFKIIFAIIGKLDATGKIRLPFFSQVTLRRCYLQLTAYKYKVSLKYIGVA